MTLQIQQVSVVIAARAGQLPVYPQVGQGLLGGTVTRVLAGDSLSHHEQMDELRIIFEREFDRGDLSPQALQAELWQAHWYRTSRKALQRAADLLVLASSAGISSGSRLAQQCEGLAAALDSIVNAKPQAHPIADALLRGDPIPADDSLRRAELAASALRADGIIPAMPAQPGNCQDCNAIPTSPHGCGRDGMHEVGQTYDDSPFRLYQFAHEMHELLKRIRVKVGAVHVVLNNGRQPSPTMQCECDQAISDIWSLLARIDGRDPLETDVEGRDARRAVIEASERHQAALDQAERAEALCQRLEKSMTCEILEADFTTSIIRLQARQPLVGINGGLWKLVPYQCKSGNAGGAA